MARRLKSRDETASAPLVFSWLIPTMAALACGVPEPESPRATAPAETESETPPSEDEAPTRNTPPERPPVVEPAVRRFEALPIPGFLPAPMFIPENAENVTRELRVFVFAHGAGGRGEHHCSFWEPQLPPDIVLVCPQGSLLRRGDPDGGAFFPDHLALRSELTALIDAVRGRLGSRISDRGWRYVGYSQGATMGALAIVGEISVFRDLVLIEGGGENWSLERALDFEESGGQRVLLACGTPGCDKRGRASVAVLEQAGLEARHEYAAGVGHTYAGGVGNLVLRAMMAWEGSP